jgi:putative cell wall-binding protein
MGIAVVLTVVLTLALSLALAPATASALTQRDAIDWCQGKVGQFVEYRDASNLNQCFDFSAAYAHYCGWAGWGYGMMTPGAVYRDEICPAGWKRVSAAELQAGDIFCQEGHTGVVKSRVGNILTGYDQNNPGNPDDGSQNWSSPVGVHTFNLLTVLGGFRTTFDATPPDTEPAPTRPVTQHEGGTRQETAARASAEAYPDPAEVDSVILAYSYDFPDALAASYLAGVLDAPLLLCDTDEIPAATASELLRLNPSVVYIVGGTGVISEDVESSLHATPGVSSVTRLGGAGREETAYLIACEACVRGGVPVTAFVANAADFPDALSAGSLAASQGVPILLTATGELDEWTRRFLEKNNIRDVVIVGGAGSVSEGVAGQLRTLPHSPSVTRWWGTGRYETSADVLDKAIAKWSLTPAIIGLASGDDFPDALVGGAAVGNRGGLLAITDPHTLSVAAEGLISTYGDNISGVEIFGGTGTIRVANEVRELLS